LDNVKRSGRNVLFRDYRYWLAVPTLLSMPFTLTAIFIHQDFLLRAKSWSPEWMATCFVLFGLVHWVSSICFGVLVDRFSGLALFRMYTLPMIAALFLVGNLEGYWLAAVMMTLLGISIGAVGPVCGGMWAEVYSKNIQAGVRSAAGSVGILSTAFAPILLGWLIDLEISIQIIFNVLGLFFLLSLGLLRFSYSKTQNL